MQVYREALPGSYLATDLEPRPYPSQVMVTQGSVPAGQVFLDASYLLEGQNEATIELDVATRPTGRFHDGLRLNNIYDLMSGYQVQYALVPRARVQSTPFDLYHFPLVYANEAYAIYRIDPRRSTTFYP